MFMLWCDIHNKTVRVTANITGGKSGKAVISAESFNSEKNHTPAVQSFEYKDGKLDALYKMGDDCLLWSEHEPNLYKLRIDIYGDVSEHIIGMREFRTEGGKFTIKRRKNLSQRKT